MDFEGQKLAELIMYRLLIAFAALGFLAGYAAGSFKLMAQINAAGLALTLLLVVPDWPWFNRHPLNWLPPLNPDGDGGAGGGSGKAAAAAGDSGSGSGAASAAGGGAAGRSGRLTRR